MQAAALRSGFSEVALQSQDCFRRVMDAFARPAIARSWSADLSPPEPLFPSAAAVALTLCDFETTLWVDASIAQAPEALRFLSFHTGTRLVSDPAKASFALIADVAAMPPFSAFSQGTQEYPDRSTTLIIQIERFTDEFAFTGPGIRDSVRFGCSPAPDDFRSQLAANRALFPRGIDLIFASRDAVAALPRSVRLLEG